MNNRVCSTWRRIPLHACSRRPEAEGDQHSLGLIVSRGEDGSRSYDALRDVSESSWDAYGRRGTVILARAVRGQTSVWTHQISGGLESG